MATLLVYDSTLTGGPRLHDPSLLAPSLGLRFPRWKVSLLLYHFLPLPIPFSLFIDRVNLGDLGEGKAGRHRLYYLFRSIPPSVGL